MSSPAPATLTTAHQSLYNLGCTMRRLTTSLLGILVLLSCLVGVTHATQYPPGPAYRTCPDTLTLYDVQQPDTLIAPCHPVNPDTVYSVKGIITGFDNNGSGRAFYIQTRNVPAAAFTGVDVFTGGVSFPGLALGDSVRVSGKIEEFGNGTEISGYDASNATLDVAVGKISSGNSLPVFHVGTVTELRELGGPAGESEKWEGMLVKVNTPMRVARSGAPFPTFLFLVVENSCVAGCDSVAVDVSTLATPAVGLPAFGTVIDSVQGIYEERQRSGAPSFRIQVRNGADLFAAVPPNLVDAFSVEDDQIRVIYDRPVTEATAENVNNYSLLIGNVDSAVQSTPNGDDVILTVSSYPSDGTANTVTAENIASLSSGLSMSPQNKSFHHGVMTVGDIQAPDLTYLGGSPCEDRSRFAGAGNQTPGLRVTFRGVNAGKAGELNFLMDAAGGPRSGLAIFRPNVSMVTGHLYRITAVIQEFFGVTEASQPSAGPPFYITDEGTGTIPAPAVLSVATASDSTCDSGGSLTTAEDYEGVLIKVEKVKVVDRGAPSSDPPPGGFFDIAGPHFVYSDSMNVENDGDHTYDPTLNDLLDVTGGLHWSFGQFRIYPRDDADIVFYGQLAVDGETPGGLSFAVYPNPARRATIDFALPRGDDVEIAVFDLGGRRVATIAEGNFAAGRYSREWNGFDAAGKPAGTGLYFYRLRALGETRVVRGVKLE